MLDIGSFRMADPYEEIARTIKYAVTWQIKEKVYVDGKPVDLDKLIALIRDAGFGGYLPLETLGEGDPRMKVAARLRKFPEGDLSESPVPARPPDLERRDVPETIGQRLEVIFRPKSVFQSAK